MIAAARHLVPLRSAVHVDCSQTMSESHEAEGKHANIPPCCVSRGFPAEMTCQYIQRYMPNGCRFRYGKGLPPGPETKILFLRGGTV